MIDLFTASTPNGRKISIALEEMELSYRVHHVRLGEQEQKRPSFLRLNPNGRIPVIVDRDAPDVPVFESGAILIYLAEKTGRFLPRDPRGRKTVLEWLMWQMGGLGPMLGQVHHFVKFNKGKAPYAEERYAKEAKRLYGVLDRRLAEVEYVAGDYSIADMSIWPWISRFEWQGIDLNAFPEVARWYKAIADRPAVQRGYHVPVEQPGIPMP